jgi:hypothetical protein
VREPFASAVRSSRARPRKAATSSSTSRSKTSRAPNRPSSARCSPSSPSPLVSSCSIGQGARSLRSRPALRNGGREGENFRPPLNRRRIMWQLTPLSVATSSTATTSFTRAPAWLRRSNNSSRSRAMIAPAFGPGPRAPPRAGRHARRRLNGSLGKRSRTRRRPTRTLGAAAGHWLSTRMPRCQRKVS